MEIVVEYYAGEQNGSELKAMVASTNKMLNNMASLVVFSPAVVSDSRGLPLLTIL